MLHVLSSLETSESSEEWRLIIDSINCCCWSISSLVRFVSACTNIISIALCIHYKSHRSSLADSLSIFLMMFDLIWSVDMNMNRFMARRAVLFRAHLSVRNVFGNDFYSLLPPMQLHYAFILRERGDWVKKKSNCARHFFLQEIDLFSFHVVADCVTIRGALWAPTVCTHETRRERPARGWHICHSR